MHLRQNRVTMIELISGYRVSNNEWVVRWEALFTKGSKKFVLERTCESYPINKLIITRVFHFLGVPSAYHHLSSTSGVLTERLCEVPVLSELCTHTTGASHSDYFAMPFIISHTLMECVFNYRIMDNLAIVGLFEDDDSLSSSSRDDYRAGTSSSNSQRSGYASVGMQTKYELNLIEPTDSRFKHLVLSNEMEATRGPGRDDLRNRYDTQVTYP